jgi:hypothetical protein
MVAQPAPREFETFGAGGPVLKSTEAAAPPQAAPSAAPFILAVLAAFIWS